MRVVIFLLCFLLGVLFIKFPGGDCAVSFDQSPDDPTVVVLGSNSTNVSLHWKCSLGGQKLVLLKIVRYDLADPNTAIQLAVRSGGNNTISAEHFRGRGIMSGTGCEVTLLIFNVTVQDGKYKYGIRVTTPDDTTEKDFGLRVAVTSTADSSPTTTSLNTNTTPTPTAAGSSTRANSVASSKELQFIFFVAALVFFQYF